MGSYGDLVLPRGAHRQPEALSGLDEWYLEQQAPEVCRVCKDASCPGALGRVCVYEQEICSACGCLDCISNQGHDCPREDRCSNCGYPEHLHSSFEPECGMPRMKLCPDCGSATCVRNPAVELATDEDWWRAQIEDYSDDHDGWYEAPSLTISEEVEFCWEQHSTQHYAHEIRQQIEDAWDQRFMWRWESARRQQEWLDSEDSVYSLYELEQDYRDGNAPAAFILRQLQQHPAGRLLRP